MWMRTAQLDWKPRPPDDAPPLPGRLQSAQKRARTDSPLHGCRRTGVVSFYARRGQGCQMGPHRSQPLKRAPVRVDSGTPPWRPLPRRRLKTSSCGWPADHHNWPRVRTPQGRHLARRQWTRRPNGPNGAPKRLEQRKTPGGDPALKR
jgi:hypothetical protein